jgi:hypothetical protein
VWAIRRIVFLLSLSLPSVIATIVHLFFMCLYTELLQKQHIVSFRGLVGCDASLKMEAARSSETLSYHNITRGHNPENVDMNLH